MFLSSISYQKALHIGEFIRRKGKKFKSDFNPQEYQTRKFLAMPDTQTQLMAIKKELFTLFSGIEIDKRSKNMNL
jgi:hypothetical protein